MSYFFLLLSIFCCSANICSRAENILCRSCGTRILTSDAIISKISNASQYSFEDTIFETKEIVVQVLIKHLFFRHPLITSNNSDCVSAEDWEEDKSWFPDYAMTSCFCPNCGVFVGWVFKNDSSIVVKQQTNDKFYGIVLRSIIGENCNYFNKILNL